MLRGSGARAWVCRRGIAGLDHPSRLAPCPQRSGPAMQASNAPSGRAGQVAPSLEPQNTPAQTASWGRPGGGERAGWQGRCAATRAATPRAQPAPSGWGGWHRGAGVAAARLDLAAAAGGRRGGLLPSAHTPRPPTPPPLSLPAGGQPVCVAVLHSAPCVAQAPPPLLLRRLLAHPRRPRPGRLLCQDRHRPKGKRTPPAPAFPGTPPVPPTTALRDGRAARVCRGGWRGGGARRPPCAPRLCSTHVSSPPPTHPPTHPNRTSTTW